MSKLRRSARNLENWVDMSFTKREERMNAKIIEESQYEYI
jgi:hypothetical protein